MEEQAWKGLREKLGMEPDEPFEGDRKLYVERLEHELDVIKKMGFPGYFLIVADFINYAKANGIPVGPGRGSSAGSLVAYGMNITNVDPVEYDIIFERFLNPGADLDAGYRRRLLHARSRAGDPLRRRQIRWRRS